MRTWILGLAAVAVVAVAAPAVAEANWAWVTDRAERFTIEMPGPAARQSETITETGAPSVFYEVDLGSSYFTVASTAVPGSFSAEQIGAALDSSIDGAVSSGKGVLTWKRTVTVSGQPAREAEYTVTAEGQTLRARVLATYRPERLYSLVVVEDASEPAGKAERMIRSFKLLE